MAWRRWSLLLLLTARAGTTAFIMAGVVVLLVGGSGLGSPARTAAAQSPAQPLPDLVVLGVAIELETGGSCQFNPGDSGVSARIFNQGAAAAGPFAVQVNGVQQAVPSLGSGAEARLWFHAPTTQPVTAIIDVLKQVAESDESSNMLTTFVGVPTAPPTCTAIPQVTPATPYTQTPTPAELGIDVRSFTTVSLANPNDPLSREAGFLWLPPTGPRIYQLVRVTTGSNGPSVVQRPVAPGTLGSLDFTLDSLTPDVTVACYQLRSSTGSSVLQSTVECVIPGTATGLVPTNFRIRMDQSGPLVASWDPTPGAASYLVWQVGTEDFLRTTSTEVSISSTGGLMCVVTASLDGAGSILGLSNVLCAVPELLPGPLPAATPTPTATRTAAPPIQG